MVTYNGVRFYIFQQTSSFVHLHHSKANKRKLYLFSACKSATTSFHISARSVHDNQALAVSSLDVALSFSDPYKTDLRWTWSPRISGQSAASHEMLQNYKDRAGAWTKRDSLFEFQILLYQ